MQEVGVTESISGDKFATRYRINALTDIMACSKHTALDIVRFRLNIIVFSFRIQL